VVEPIGAVQMLPVPEAWHSLDQFRRRLARPLLSPSQCYCTWTEHLDSRPRTGCMKLLQDLAVVVHTMPLENSALRIKRPMDGGREIGLLTDNTIRYRFAVGEYNRTTDNVNGV
jgi:hypothetical protein